MSLNEDDLNDFVENNRSSYQKKLNTHKRLGNPYNTHKIFEDDDFKDSDESSNLGNINWNDSDDSKMDIDDITPVNSDEEVKIIEKKKKRPKKIKVPQIFGNDDFINDNLNEENEVKEKKKPQKIIVSQTYPGESEFIKEKKTKKRKKNFLNNKSKDKFLNSESKRLKKESKLIKKEKEFLKNAPNYEFIPFGEKDLIPEEDRAVFNAITHNQYKPEDLKRINETNKQKLKEYVQSGNKIIDTKYDDEEDFNVKKNDKRETKKRKKQPEDDENYTPNFRTLSNPESLKKLLEKNKKINESINNDDYDNTPINENLKKKLVAELTKANDKKLSDFDTLEEYEEYKKNNKKINYKKILNNETIAKLKKKKLNVSKAQIENLKKIKQNMKDMDPDERKKFKQKAGKLKKLEYFKILQDRAQKLRDMTPDEKSEKKINKKLRIAYNDELKKARLRYFFEHFPKKFSTYAELTGMTKYNILKKCGFKELIEEYKAWQSGELSDEQNKFYKEFFREFFEGIRFAKILPSRPKGLREFFGPARCFKSGSKGFWYVESFDYDNNELQYFRVNFGPNPKVNYKELPPQAGIYVDNEIIVTLGTKPQILARKGLVGPELKEKYKNYDK